MTIDIDWWENLAKELREQCNASTKHPIFVVEHKVRYCGYDTEVAEGVAWLDEEGVEFSPKEVEKLEFAFHANGSEPDHTYRTGYVDRWHPVQMFLTRAAAEKFLEVNQHRFCEMRIFVDSAYRNTELIKIREQALIVADEIRTYQNRIADLELQVERLSNVALVRSVVK